MDRGRGGFLMLGYQKSSPAPSPVHCMGSVLLGVEAVIERARGVFLIPGYRKSSPAPCPFNDMGVLNTEGVSRLRKLKRALSNGMVWGRVPISGTPV